MKLLIQKLLREGLEEETLETGINIGDGFIIKYNINPPDINMFLNDGSKPQLMDYKMGTHVGYIHFGHPNFGTSDEFYKVGGSMQQDVYIDPKYRGKGIGSKLYLSANAALYKERGVRIQSESEIGQSKESQAVWRRFYENGDAEIVHTETDRGVEVGEDVGEASEGVKNGVIYTGNIYALKA